MLTHIRQMAAGFSTSTNAQLQGGFIGEAEATVEDERSPTYLPFLTK